MHILNVTCTAGQKLLFESKFTEAIPAAMQCLRVAVELYGLASVELVPSYLILGRASIGTFFIYYPLCIKCISVFFTLDNKILCLLQLYVSENNTTVTYVNLTYFLIIAPYKYFLSASLCCSKRGAYWDRLCRDVVGWLVVTCVHCGQMVHPRLIVTMEH